MLVTSPILLLSHSPAYLLTHSYTMEHSLLLTDDDSNDPNYMTIMSRLVSKILVLKHFQDPEDIDNLTIRCFISSFNTKDQITIRLLSPTYSLTHPLSYSLTPS